MNKIFGVAIFLLLSPFSIEASEKVKFDVEKFQLKNGLTVLLHVDKTAPIVSYQSWFKVGSLDEEVGYTGIAHLFEHMMFKGAKRYTNKDFDLILKSNGATNNAFTTRDYTAYYIDLPSSRIELAIDLESDRMESLIVNADNLKSEREVVKEERRYRVENRPMGLLFETLFSNVFKSHPYRWPVIGWMKDLDNITVEKCQEFFKKFYAPNNAVISVAGDFNASQVKSLIEKYYGGIPSQEIKRTERPVEPIQKVVRELTVSRKVTGQHLALGYKTSKSGESDSYALDLLAEVLGGGTSSRLHKRMIYTAEIADSVTAYPMTMKEDGVFSVFVSLKAGKGFDEALRIVYGEMWKARNQLIPDKELEKAKNALLVSYIDELKTVNGKANALALNELMMGSYEFLFKDIDVYLAVTPQRLKEVAEKYLQPWQSTVVRLRAEN